MGEREEEIDDYYIEDRFCKNITDCKDQDEDIPRICLLDFSDSESEKEGFCDCSPYFGWKGRDCDIEGAQIYYMRIALYILTLLSIILIFVSCSLFYQYIRGRSSEVKHEIRISIFFSILTGIFLLLATLVQFPHVYRADHFKFGKYNSLFEEEPIIDVTPQEDLAYDVLLQMAVVFHSITMLVIVVTWLKTLIKLDEDFPAQVYVSTITLKRIIVVVSILYLATLFLFLGLKFPLEALFFSLIDSLILCLAFIFGYCRFRQKMNRYDIKAKRFQEILERIKQTATGMVVFTVLFVIFQFCFATLYSEYDSLLEVGGFNYIHLFRDLSSICIICVQFIMLHYSYFITDSLTKTHSSKPNKKNSKRYSKNTVSSLTYKQRSDLETSYRVN